MTAFVPTSLWLLAASLALAGCAASRGAAPAPDAQAAVAFPDRASASRPEGSFPDPDRLRRMMPGMSKAQLHDLLGPPHFSEGVFSVRRWDYIFNLRTPAGIETCQYQIRFDASMRAEAGNWDKQVCADLIHPKPVVAPPPAPPAPPPAAPRPVPPPEPRKVTLAADALFGFDRADLAGMSSAGRQRLDALAAELRGVEVQQIRVIGHTDRLGAAAYNDRLSEQRAATVVRYLVDAGVPAGAVRGEGRGARDPVVQCGSQPRAALIACMAPNRRVELEIIGRTR